MVPWWLLAVLVFGANFALWGAVGLLRLVDAGTAAWRRHRRRGELAESAADTAAGTGCSAAARIGTDEVAVLIAAHNEEPVIEHSLAAITALVPAANVHVVSDGSTDRTVELAAACGVQVITTASNVGKAGALQAGIERFALVERFRAVMLLDADTRVDAGYFDNALPLFDDPRVVAVAGCVRTTGRLPGLSRFGRLVAFHRQRIYSTTQYVLKFGQTWRRVNATHIVPGFASLYRTDVLPHMEVNPPGLVIEDFNMTFQVYQNRLGKVGFTPAAVAETQDPDSPRDYVRQVRRWSLGLWQTVRRHPPRFNLFSLMLALMLLELLSSSLMVVLLPVVVLLLAVPAVLAPLVPPAADVGAGVATFISPESLLLGVLLPDLVLTCLVAAFHRQPRFLVYGGFFLALRVVDSALALAALALAFAARSTGQWTSPKRQRVEVEPTGAASDR